MRFADGDIPIRELPEGSVELSLASFGVEVSASAHRAALSQEQWLSRSRRKAAGGRRAEDALLKLAVGQAMDWRARDPEGFGAALAGVLPQLGELGRTNASAIEAEGGMRAFLHVADYLGNIGFNVLVPDRLQQHFLMVEVKRVGTLEEEAACFLSENERRRAIDYWNKRLPWRL